MFNTFFFLKFHIKFCVNEFCAMQDVSILCCQGRAWHQMKSTQGAGMGGGIPLRYVREKIKI